MFRLIKLAMYAMIGYVLYELYQGMTKQQGQLGGGGGSRSGGSFGNEDSSFAGLTGGGEGRIATAADTTGGEMRHRVGRGVIRSGAAI